MNKLEERIRDIIFKHVSTRIESVLLFGKMGIALSEEGNPGKIELFPELFFLDYDYTYYFLPYKEKDKELARLVEDKYRNADFSSSSLREVRQMANRIIHEPKCLKSELSIRVYRKVVDKGIPWLMAADEVFLEGGTPINIDLVRGL